MGRIRASPSPEVRFWAKVSRTDGCWHWLGFHAANGYGKFWDGNRKVYVHRFSYELQVGPIPAGLDIDHLCNFRGCVNPEHLRPATRRENVLRGVAPNVVIHRTLASGFCLKGHALVGDNAQRLPSKNGNVQCRTCSRERCLAAYYRKKARIT